MQTTHVSSLPDPWIEKIWAAMRGTYGAEFDRQWECPPCPPDVELSEHVARYVAEVKAVWGRGLAGFQQNPRAIAHALENMPERPPNLVQFAAMCRRRPDPMPALDSPKADPRRVAAEVQRMRQATAAAAGPKAWAHRLQATVERGERLTIAQREMVAAALQHGSAE